VGHLKLVLSKKKCVLSSLLIIVDIMVMSIYWISSSECLDNLFEGSRKTIKQKGETCQVWKVFWKVWWN